MKTINFKLSIDIENTISFVENLKSQVVKLPTAITLIKLMAVLRESQRLKDHKLYELRDKYAERTELGDFAPVFDSDQNVIPNAVKINDPSSYTNELNSFLNNTVDTDIPLLDPAEYSSINTTVTEIEPVCFLFA